MKELAIKGYEVQITYDMGGSSHLGYFTHYPDAMKAAKGKGSWGGDGYIKDIDTVIRVYESYEEFKNQADINERQAALNKLSERERQLLGLE